MRGFIVCLLLSACVIDETTEAVELREGRFDTGDDYESPLLPMCGWESTNQLYACSEVGEDPSGVHPVECPIRLYEGGPCGTLTAEGCCSASGDLWYCGYNNDTQFVVREQCWW